MMKAQNRGLATSCGFCGTQLRLSSAGVASPLARPCGLVVTADSPYGERFRLHNLSPQEGSRKSRTRKGRGYSAGKGGSCGFGMRGQKSRSGAGIRPGFEGGQTPLYRRVPKLRGVAGGMPSGRQNFVTVNISTLEERFVAGDVVDLEILKEKGIIKATGKERKLPLKVLGDGDLKIALEVKAGQFSQGAQKKIQEAGGTPTVLPRRPKWTQELYDQRVAEGVIVPRKTKRWYYLQSKAAAEAQQQSSE